MECELAELFQCPESKGPGIISLARGWLYFLFLPVFAGAPTGLLPSETSPEYLSGSHWWQEVSPLLE